VQCLLLCDTVRRVSRTVTHVLYSIVAATMGMHEPSLPLLPPLPPLLAAASLSRFICHEKAAWLHEVHGCMVGSSALQGCLLQLYDLGQ
jgi:hypothetical protein